MNKKILAILMALLMVLVGAVASADAFSKVYEGTGAPAAEFTFSVTGGAVVEGTTSSDVTIPAASNVTVAADAFTGAGTNEIKINVNWDAFTEVGVYTYTLKEDNSKLAGVNYDETEMTIYVFVYGDGTNAVMVKKGADKSENGEDLTFNNVYQAGSLAISKTVAGKYGDPNKYFEITVTLTGVEGEDYSEAAVVANGGKYTNESVTVGVEKTFEIKDGETITLSNIPHGVTYTVVEKDYTDLGYTASVVFSDETNKKIDSTETDTVAITNTKDGDDIIDTGVNTDNMPYIMLMAFVMIIAAAVVLKKRTVNE